MHLGDGVGIFDATDTYGIDMNHDQHAVDIIADDHGIWDVGPAVADTKNSGHLDTAIVAGADHDTLLYTDTNSDGIADYRMQFAPNGDYLISVHVGPQEWMATEAGQLGSDGKYLREELTPFPLTPEMPEVGGNNTHSSLAGPVFLV